MSKKETTLDLPVTEQRAEQEQAAEAAAHGTGASSARHAGDRRRFASAGHAEHAGHADAGHTATGHAAVPGHAGGHRANLSVTFSTEGRRPWHHRKPRWRRAGLPDCHPPFEEGCTVRA